MYRNLCHIYWDDNALKSHPAICAGCSKQGFMDEYRSETVVVNAPHGDYVFSVMTNHDKDHSYAHNSEANVFIRNLSALLWHYFEPKDNWQQPDGYDKFMNKDNE